MSTILLTLGVVFGAYLVGSIPTGYLIVKYIKKIDIREIGSGGTGATNVKRVLGKRGFFGVLLLDAFKGFLPVFASKYIELKYNLYIQYSIIPVLASIAVILGHSKSIFLNFTGGKSVASGVGTIIALNWSVGLITAATWSIITYLSKYVSLGSVIAVMFTPVLMYLFKAPLSYILFCLTGGLYIVYLHRENVKRLIAGTENKVR